MVRFHPLGLAQRALVMAFFVGWLSTISQTARCAENSATVTGRVMSSAGEFLAGAKVSVWLESLRPSDSGRKPPTAETLTDREGRYVFNLELAGGSAQQARLKAAKPGFQLVTDYTRWRLSDVVELIPGKSSGFSFILQPGFYVAGQLVDVQGKPVANARVLGGWAKGGSIYDAAYSDPDGRFQLFRMPLEPDDKDSRGTIRVEHAGLLHAEVGNVYRMTPDERTHLRIVMPPGRVVEGKVVDNTGRPLPGALVESLFSDRRLRQATLTKNDGSFRLSGLPDALATLKSHSADWNAKGKQELRTDRDHTDLTLKLPRVERPKPASSYDLLGLTVANNSSELSEFYDLENQLGVVVLGRAGFSPFDSTIREGAWLMCAGLTARPALSVYDLVDQMIREIDNSSKPGEEPVRCTILCLMRSAENDDVGSINLILHAEEVRRLRELPARLRGK